MAIHAERGAHLPGTARVNNHCSENSISPLSVDLPQSFISSTKLTFLEAKSRHRFNYDVRPRPEFEFRARALVLDPREWNTMYVQWSCPFPEGKFMWSGKSEPSRRRPPPPQHYNQNLSIRSAPPDDSQKIKLHHHSMHAFKIQRPIGEILRTRLTVIAFTQRKKGKR